MNEETKATIDRARALLAAAGSKWDDVAVAGTPSGYWAVANARGDYETAHADAALIAAAPGLLATLCDALNAAQAREANALTACLCGRRGKCVWCRVEDHRLCAEAAERRAEEAEAQAAAWREHTSALVTAMKTWGSWEDGIPDASDAGECGDVGRAFNAARDALVPDMNLKAWRCSACGETAASMTSAWRWTGSIWQHTHADAPQAGHFDAVYVDPARPLLDRLHAAETERDALRGIIADCAAAIGNGSSCTSHASVEFMAMIPAEIRAEVAALRDRAGLAEGREAAAKANAEQMAGWLDARNAGLVQMARERDALREKLAAAKAKVCGCVNTTYAFDPGRTVVLPLAGYSITAGVGCPSCAGSGAVIVESEQ